MGIVMKCSVFNNGSREKWMPKSCGGGEKKGVHRHSQDGFDHKHFYSIFFVFAKQDLGFV